MCKYNKIRGKIRHPPHQQKYRKETIDIEDIEWEEADLEEDTLFAEPEQTNEEP